MEYFQILGNLRGTFGASARETVVKRAFAHCGGAWGAPSAAGTMVFEVNYGTKSVEVSLASAAHASLSAKAAADW